MKTSTKVFSASTTLLTLVAMGMPLVASAATSNSVGTAPVTTPTPVNGNVTMQTTDTAQFTPGFLTIDGATNYIFPSTAIKTGGETVSTVAANDTWTAGTVGVAGTSTDAVSVNPAITSTDFTAAKAPFLAGAITSDGVQVTDNRGTNAGWSLYAYPSDLIVNTATPGTTTAATGLSLNGSTITLTGTAATNLNIGETLPTVNTVTLNTGAGNNNNTTVNAAQLVATTGTTTTALPLNATGTNELPFSSVTLNVPAGVAQATTYSGIITWDLTTAP